MKVLDVTVNNEDVNDTKSQTTELIVDTTPPAVHRDISLLKNAITLGRRSERIITCTLLLFGGIFAPYWHSKLQTVIIIIA